ncbi:hypothetical protein NPIL_255841 [Nephila pilipes]|uniref:Uncharacterized protein n=1 Tax=Nephila pilipes TaxID=299642 RepID=A0A8X6PSS4_NEPPI|nr:hypothetical protein NPIL_255841 [Nephila pilipes]
MHPFLLQQRASPTKVLLARFRKDFFRILPQRHFQSPKSSQRVPLSLSFVNTRYLKGTGHDVHFRGNLASFRLQLAYGNPEIWKWSFP